MNDKHDDSNGPDFGDGCSLEGFVGGCERMGCHDDSRAPEPVAWRAWDDNLSRWDFTLWPDEECNDGREWAPVYTSAPPKPDAAPSVPDGWQLVPVEPTQRMLEAAFLRIESEGISTTPWLRASIYRAMLAAAPKPGETT